MTADLDPDRRDPTYLGDGVYAAHDGCQIWLRANDADWYRPGTADIALEPEVLLALVAYARRVGFIVRNPPDTSSPDEPTSPATPDV